MSTNVLMKQNLDACISDVGLTALMNASATNNYGALEVTDYMKSTSQSSDVYSFSWLLLEMFAGNKVYYVINDPPKPARSLLREEWRVQML